MILRKIKQILGMGSGSEKSGRSGQDVVVQEERSGADTETEAAVKGVDEGGSEGAAEESAEPSGEPTVADEEPVEEPDADESAETAEEEVGSGDVDEPVATGTDADASTESLVDEAEANDDPASRAEPAEAAGPGAEDVDTDVEDADTDAGDVDSDAEEGTDVDEIKGIGPAYSDRLGEVDIHTVAQLAEADAADLAERTGVAEGTVQKWIDRAQEYEE